MNNRPRINRPRALALLGAAAVATAIAAQAAHGTDGNLYPQGAGAFTTGSLATASQVSPDTVQVNAAATGSAPTGAAWSMNWGCPVPGSEIAAVYFNALRHGAASSADVQVQATLTDAQVTSLFNVTILAKGRVNIGYAGAPNTLAIGYIWNNRTKRWSYLDYSFIDAAIANGMPPNADFNGSTQEGVG